MPQIYGNSQLTLPNTTGNQQVRLTKDGAVITQEWVQSLVSAGQVFGVQTGSGTTPDTFNATYAAAEQDLYIYVPANTVIIPLMIFVGFEDTGTAQVMDVLAAYSLNGDSAVTGDALIAYNYKTGASPASSCVATAVVTAAGTTSLGGDDFLEFWRPYAGFGEDAFNGSTAPGLNAIAGARWTYATDGFAPIIGSTGTAGALSVYASAQAGTGFITVVYAELAASQV